MINAGILRTTENAPNSQNLIKSEKKLPRLKAKALGDVQNTLHSRPGNIVNQNTNSAVKASSKSSNLLKSAANENNLPSKIPSGKKINVSPSKSAVKSLLRTPIVDKEILDIHHHLLCEEDQLSYLNDCFLEYKFSEEHIKNLVRSVKTPVRPFSVPFYEPCEDIKMPDVKKYEEDSFFVFDIFSDTSMPEVPALE